MIASARATARRDLSAQAAALGNHLLQLHACLHAQRMLPPWRYHPHMVRVRPAYISGHMSTHIIAERQCCWLCLEWDAKLLSSCHRCLSLCRDVPKPVLHTGVEAQPEKSGSPRLSTAEIARRACEAQRDPLLHQSSSGWFARPLHRPSFNTFNSASSFELSTAGKSDTPRPVFASVACQQPYVK